MLVAGLTGNYGMGKSTVLRMFRDLGALTLDADEVVNILLSDAAVLRKIREAFGDSVFLCGEALDRAALASIIFQDAEKRGSLEEILHPLVFEKIDFFLTETEGRRNGAEVVIIEIPLLFEKGYIQRFDRKITVYTEEEVALSRLEQKGIARCHALSRLRTQMPIEEKIRMADFYIDNGGTLSKTGDQVQRIYARLLSDFREREKRK